MPRIRWTAALLLFTCIIVFSASLCARADEEKSASEKKYDLKYKFKPGETLNYQVVHRAKVRTTVSGTTQTAETDTSSVKVWKVRDVGEKTGNMEFEHSVESVRMTQRLTGRKEETYDSTTDKVPPPTFAEAAKSVGITLSVIRIDPRGRVIDRIDNVPQARNDALLTLPLPDEAVAIGHEWQVPSEVEVSLKGGAVKKIQTRQQFKLVDVKNGVATVSVATVVLSPVRDPEIEAQLIQRENSGTIRFDVDAGRILSQQMDLDKQVYGFSGETSSMHYQTRFTEELLPSKASGAQPTATASKPGPVFGPPVQRK